MIQLLSAMFAACVVLALRRGDRTDERLAAVHMLLRQVSWLVLVLTISAAVTLLAWWSLPAEVGATHARNTAAYVGIGLLLETVSLLAAIAAPWVWFAVSSVVGRASVQGVTVADWWAYPVQPPDWQPAAAIVLLALGAVSRVLRA